MIHYLPNGGKILSTPAHEAEKMNGEYPKEEAMIQDETFDEAKLL